jgi:hypothetical protein
MAPAGPVLVTMRRCWSGGGTRDSEGGLWDSGKVIIQLGSMREGAEHHTVRHRLGRPWPKRRVKLSHVEPLVRLSAQP